MGEEHEFEVVWPSSRRRTVAVAPVDAIGGLNGKRIAFIWDYRFRGDEMWAVFKQAMRNRYPNVGFIEHEEFGDVHGVNEVNVLQQMKTKLRELRVDGAIVGVGA
jgi:hypothetical protein